MLLVTVPHGKREASENHDEGAILMIPHLTRALDDYGIPHTIHVGSDNYRGILDLNRAESRHTVYAKEFTEHLQKSSLHIDLHSFPFLDDEAHDTDSITKTGEDLREWSHSDVVFLTIPTITNAVFEETIMTQLEEYVTIDGYEIQPHEGYLTVFANLIMDVPSVLLELNEGSAPAFPLVAKAVAAGVAGYFGLLEPVDA